MSHSYSISYDVRETTDGVEAQFAYKDSEDHDFEISVSGEDYDDVRQELSASLIETALGYTSDFEGYFDADWDADLMFENDDDNFDEDVDDEEVDDYVAYLEDVVYELHQQINQLKADNDILQRRADDAVNKSMNTKKYNDGSKNVFDKDAFKQAIQDISDNADYYSDFLTKLLNR